jgi:protein-S-isoprenylcysteine O-methyltransferase Ste14
MKLPQQPNSYSVSTVSERAMGNWSKIARRVRVPLGFVFAVFYFWMARPTWRSMALGLIGILPGLWIRALASGYVRKNESLATSGPYAYTRNPLYLGSLLIGIGFAIASRSWWVGVALLVMFFAIYVPVIRNEEQFLRQRFPEFPQYECCVPRIWPRIRPWSARDASGSNFAFDLYLKHREYNALLGAVATMTILAFELFLFHR